MAESTESTGSRKRSTAAHAEPNTDDVQPEESSLQVDAPEATEEAEPIAEPTAEPLRLGDRGDAVRAAQRALNERGASVEVNGVFTGRMRAAVVSFQTAEGLYASGELDAATRAALDM